MRRIRAVHEIEALVDRDAPIVGTNSILDRPEVARSMPAAFAARPANGAVETRTVPH